MVSAKKPAPDVYFMALHQLGVTAHQVVALEDSRNGLRAAKAAGLACCVSPGVYMADEDFSAADLVIPEFSEMGGLAPLAEMVKHKI